MVQWKSRPIDQLSEMELRAALRELTSHLNDIATPHKMLFDSFLLGLTAGTFISGIGIAIARSIL